MHDKEIEDIKNRLQVLEDMLTSKMREFKLDDRARVNDIMTKSYRLHRSAFEEFDALIKSEQFRIYSVQDLVSQAFWEFCQNHKD